MFPMANKRIDRFLARKNVEFGERRLPDIQKSRGGNRTIDLSAYRSNAKKSQHMIDLRDRKPGDEHFDVFYEALAMPGSVYGEFDNVASAPRQKTIWKSTFSTIWKRTRAFIIAAFVGAVAMIAAVPGRLHSTLNASRKATYRALHHRRYRDQRLVAKKVLLVALLGILVGVSYMTVQGMLQDTSQTPSTGQTGTQSTTADGSSTQNSDNNQLPAVGETNANTTSALVTPSWRNEYEAIPAESSASADSTPPSSQTGGSVNTVSPPPQTSAPQNPDTQIPPTTTTTPPPTNEGGSGGGGSGSGGGSTIESPPETPIEIPIITPLVEDPPVSVSLP